MTNPAELSEEELVGHAVAIAAAKTEAQFVRAFAAYVEDTVTRETDPYEKIALFVHGLIEGHQEMIKKLVHLHGGGAA